jgi:putative ATP-dependent endonuclease of the OLD family
MKLEEVVINNYCSCHALILPLSDFNPIIGYNNSGKSNILRAIAWLLRKSVLPAHCFGDLNSPVTVEGIISTVNIDLLPANQQAQVAPYIAGGRLRFRRRQDAPNATAAQVKIDVLDPKTGNWTANPTGLDNAIASLFPDPLYIEAMDDAAEDVARFAAKNTIGLLIKYTIEQIKTSNQAAFAGVQQALAGVGNLLNGPTRIQQIADLEASATQAISDFFPGISLHLGIQTPEFDELLKGASVSLTDVPGSPRPFSSFGHGAQRSVHMALIKLLASNVQANGNGATVVLLIDEPELYLHPQAIEILRDSLKTLSGQGFQVIFSTHSSLLIGADDVLDTTMVIKAPNGRTETRAKLTAAAATLAANPHQTSVLFAIQNSTYLMFSESILLVEGKTEKMLIPELYKIVRGCSLSREKACIVEAGSSGSLFPMMQVLASVGFAPRASADLDYIFKVAPGEGLISPVDPDYVSCKAWFNANQGMGFFVGADGFPCRKDANGIRARISPEAAFGLMAAALPSEVGRLVGHLRQQGFWIWSKGAIEAHLGIGKNDADRLAFIQTARNTGNVNHAIDPHELQALIGWM